MVLDKNQHSVYLLQYILIMCTKHRASVISPKISARLHQIFINMDEAYGMTLETWDSQSDYIYLTLRACPSAEISKLINTFKTTSSRLIKKEFPAIRPSLEEDSFWARGFFLISTGEADEEAIQAYLETQDDGTSMQTKKG